jgi:hypothetical protein
MTRGESAFGSAREEIVTAVHRALRVGLGALLAIVSTSGPARAAEPPRGADNLVRAVKVLPDKAPDSSSLKAMVDTVTRGCKCNDDKMIAIDNFMRISHYHRAYPPGGPPLLWFNNYGWSLCGGLAGLQMSLYGQIPGWSWRGVSVPGHNMSEAKYDGAWHWVDCFTKFHTWRPDPHAPNGRTIACHEDIKADAKLVTEALVYDEAEKIVYARNNRKEMIDGKLNWTAPALLVCGDELKYCLYLRHTGLGAECNTPDPQWSPAVYSAEVDLRPGLSLENTWEQLAPPSESWPIKDNVAVGHDCGNKDLCNDPGAGPVLEPYFQRVRSYSNGRLICAPDFSSEAVIQSFAAKENAKYDKGAIVPENTHAPASVTVALDSPFLVVRAGGVAEGADKVEVSTDGGKGFFGADLKNLTASVKGRLSAWVRVTFKTSLKSLRIEEIVMNNAGVLPYLSPGRNKVSVTVADPKLLGENKLVVTYAYAPGYRDKSFEDLYKEHKPLFAQQDAHWATQTPTVVQKTYAARDLPATFDIDVPTPKDKYPVYPRMLFLRREVVSASGKPLPLPGRVQTPKKGADDELKTLPNPYLIGTQPPPAAAAAK